jgi:hypothetical protein
MYILNACVTADSRLPHADRLDIGLINRFKQGRSQGSHSMDKPMGAHRPSKYTGSKWDITQNLAWLSLLSKCHMVSRYTVKCNFIQAHKK